MADLTRRIRVPRRIKQKPLQAGKFGGVVLTLGVAVAGFFRIIDPSAIIGGPTLWDGQFLALVLLPLVSLALVVLVFLETLVSGYQSIKSAQSLGDQVRGRFGYLILRGVESGVALLGVVIILTALPPLLAASTPAPAGVGIMLLLFVVGLGILCASLVRSAAELFVVGTAT